jgi:neutral ceramidase
MLHAGCYECDITPPLGMERPGNYTKTYVNSIHDPLKVRAVVFGSGDERAAVVSVDTCVVDARLVAEARKRIQQRCGIPAEKIMIAASHTHSGGPLFGFLATDFADAPNRLRELAVEQSVVIDPLYLEWCVAQIVTAVIQADRNKCEAKLSFDTAHVPGVAFNRRFKMKNGRVYTHPGKCNRDIVAPAGPVDDEIAVLGIWGDNCRLIGCIVNFACHATTSPGGISADWIYYLEQTVRGVLGQEAILIFLSGAAGDMTQIDNQSAREDEFGEHWARVVGASVGSAAVRLLECAKPQEESELKVLRSNLKIPRRVPSTERLAQASQIIENFNRPLEKNEWAADAATTEFLMSKEVLILNHIAARQPSVDVEIQAIQIGPSLWLSNGAEFFAESGLAIKRQSSFPRTQVVTLANAALGYVPPPAAFLPSGGGYETVLTSYSNLATAAADTIVAQSLKLAAEFHAPKPNQGAPLKPAGTPWAYGVLGPDRD